MSLVKTVKTDLLTTEVYSDRPAMGAAAAKKAALVFLLSTPASPA